MQQVCPQKRNSATKVAAPATISHRTRNRKLNFKTTWSANTCTAEGGTQPDDQPANKAALGRCRDLPQRCTATGKDVPEPWRKGRKIPSVSARTGRNLKTAAPLSTSGGTTETRKHLEGRHSKDHQLRRRRRPSTLQTSCVI
jgi:hypothetical protein